MNTNNFSHFLSTLSTGPIKLLDKAIALNNYVPIDLSVENIALKKVDVSSSLECQTYINTYLDTKGAKVAFGGYLEHRNIYDSNSHFSPNDGKDNRNIHLGMDFWCAVNTPVLAVLDGQIHSFQNNKGYGDYGPTIILEHTINSVVFYSLYGHLSLSSISNLKVGTNVKNGQVLGGLGEASINGDYAPHLHFQLIKDIQNNRGDYPGVCSQNNLSFYKENCPNPNILLELI